MSNAVAVGKRLGVKPILARRTAAAGRNGRRMRTGDAENAHAVIGKGPRRSTSPDEVLRAAEKHRRTTRPETWPSSYGDFGKAAPGTNGLGMLVPAIRGQARNSLVPQTSASATGQQKGSKLAAFGGTTPATAGMSGTSASSAPSAPSAASSTSAASGVGKALNESQLKRLARVKGKKAWGPEAVRESQATYSRIGIANMQNRAFDSPKGNWDVSDGMPRATRRRGYTYSDVEREMNKRPPTGHAGGVFKRRYDPEDERRHRQGALAAGGMLGGGALTVSGGREVVRDTKGVRRARTSLDPGHPPEFRSGGWRSNGRLPRKPTPQESLGELMAHDKEMKSYGARLDAYRKLRNPKGAVVRGKPAGKIGAGLALLGAGAQLHRQRREPRFD